MQSMSLSREAGTVALLDDQSFFLEELGFAIPPDLALKMNSNPVSFLVDVNNEMAKRAKVEQWLRDSSARVAAGKSPLLVEAIKYWTQCPERFEFTHVLLIDYYMDQMNGLEVLAACKDWPAKRILVTGAAEDVSFSNAINSGLIQRYIPKNPKGRFVVDLGQSIRDGVNDAKRLYDHASLIEAAPWSVGRTATTDAFYADEAVTRTLQDILGTECEYITTAQPLGVLALGYGGGLRYIAIASDAQLKDLAKSAQAQGLSAEDAKQIEMGKCLPNMECHIQLRERVYVAPIKATVDVAALDSKFHFAEFTVDTPFAPSAEQSYGAYRAKTREILSGDFDD